MKCIGRVCIYIYSLEIRIRIYDSFSLKDKRKTVNSILDYARFNLNVSAAEVGDQDMINLAGLAFVVVTSDNSLGESILAKIIRKIETNYQVEIIEEYMERLV